MDRAITQPVGLHARARSEPELAEETLKLVEHAGWLTKVEFNVHLPLHTHGSQGPERDPNSGAQGDAPCNCGQMACDDILAQDVVRDRRFRSSHATRAYRILVYL